MSPHDVTRRAALGIVGAGSVIALAGCAASVKPVDAAASGSSSSSSSASSSSSSSSASASPSESIKDYGTTIKNDKYDTSAGAYEPATREHPAKNIPKPVLDDKAKENSADGFYANLVFMAGALKYLFETGSDEMINKSALAQSEKDGFLKNDQSSFDSIKDGEIWFGNPQVTFAMRSPRPSKASGGGYNWGGMMVIDLGEFRAFPDGTSEDYTDEKQRKTETSVYFQGKYSDGAWQIKSF